MDVLNHTLVITTILSSPFTMLKDGVGLVGNGRFEGYIPDLMQQLSDLVGFKYELRLVEDGQYGSKARDGMFDGMIGEVVRRTADLAAADLTITPNRERQIDSSIPFMPAHYTMLSLRPPGDEDDCNEPGIQTFDDLARQSEVSYGILAYGPALEYFWGTRFATHERLYANMMEAEPSVFVRTVDDGVERVRSSGGDYVFIMESPAAEYAANQAPCNLQVSGVAARGRGYGLAFPIGCPYRDLINLAILELQEIGTFEELYSKWWFDRLDGCLKL